MFFWNSLAFSMIQADVGYLISGSFAFSKTSLNIWNFMVHVLLKPGLENFEHYFASVWDECNCAVVWAFFGIAFLWDWNENGSFQSCGHCWVFQICWHIECSPCIASSFRIWNRSTGILSPPLALFAVMLHDNLSAVATWYISLLFYWNLCLWGNPVSRLLMWWKDQFLPVFIVFYLPV